MPHPLPDRLSERCAAGLREVWRTQCGYVSGGEVAERPGLLVTATRLPDETLNCAFVTDRPADVDAALDWCVGWFHERGLRTGIELPAGTYPDIEAALAARGFAVVVRRPAMALHPLAAPDVAVPPRVHVMEVEEDAELAAYQAIQAEAFDMTPEVSTAFVPRAAVGTPGVRLFLAYHDDVPCATAAVHISAYGAGVVGVATARGYRRRGIGRTVTAAALRWASAAGADLAWLYPTPTARRLYEGLGFVALDEVAVWVEPARAS